MSFELDGISSSNISLISGSNFLYTSLLMSGVEKAVGSCFYQFSESSSLASSSSLFSSVRSLKTKLNPLLTLLELVFKRVRVVRFLGSCH